MAGRSHCTTPQPQPQPQPSAAARPLPAGLVAVDCRRCRRHLVDVIVGASVWCAACRVWTVEFWNQRSLDG